MPVLRVVEVDVGEPREACAISVVPKHSIPESDSSASSHSSRASGGGESLGPDPGVLVLSVFEQNACKVFFCFEIGFQ